MPPRTDVSSAGSFRSATVTRAPAAWSNRQAATPLLASPITVTRAPASSIAASPTMPSPKLQGTQTQQGQQDGDDPQPHHDLGLLPSFHLKVMMDGRHEKNAFPARLERDNLKNDRDRFNDKHSADHQEQQLMLADHRDRAQRRSQRKRANIPHEHGSRIGVKPQKSQTRPQDGGGEH